MNLNNDSRRPLRAQSGAALLVASLLLGACSKTSSDQMNMVDANSFAADGDSGGQSGAPLGSLTIRKSNEAPDEVLFDGRPLDPPISGNDSLSILHTYNYANRALYVVQDNGGTACPAQLYIVEVNRKGATATKAFGTCSDLVKISETPTGLVVTMPGFVGPFDDDADQEAAASGKHTFTYAQGRISERQAIRPAAKVSITAAWLSGYWVAAPRPTRELECGVDTGVRFNRDGTYRDGSYTGRYRVSDKSVSYYDRVETDLDGTKGESAAPETNSIRADGPNAFVEAGERYQRCIGADYKGE